MYNYITYAFIRKCTCTYVSGHARILHMYAYIGACTYMHMYNDSKLSKDEIEN